LKAFASALSVSWTLSDDVAIVNKLINIGHCCRRGRWGWTFMADGVVTLSNEGAAMARPCRRCGAGRGCNLQGRTPQDIFSISDITDQFVEVNTNDNSRAGQRTPWVAYRDTAGHSRIPFLARLPAGRVFTPGIGNFLLASGDLFPLRSFYVVCPRTISSLDGGRTCWRCAEGASASAVRESLRRE
jgi:hypothetical protein